MAIGVAPGEAHWHRHSLPGAIMRKRFPPQVPGMGYLAEGGQETEMM